VRRGEYRRGIKSELKVVKAEREVGRDVEVVCRLGVQRTVRRVEKPPEEGVGGGIPEGGACRERFGM